MNLLVAGGAGFIGSHFVVRHVASFPNDSVVVLDKLTYAGNRAYLDAVNGRIAFVQGDIADEALVESIVSDHAIDTIVNLAAETHVDNSIAEAAPFIHTNVVGVQALVNVCRKHPEILLVHASTDEVYGEVGDQESPRRPTDPLRPGNPYAASKAGGDLLVLAAVRTHGIRARLTRCTNNFGPHQAEEKFMPTAIRSIAKSQKIPVYGEGRQKRDWLFVTDHTDAIELVLAKGSDGEIYHVSADDERTNLDTAKAILSAMSAPHELLSFVADRPGHDFRYALDSSNMRSLGWSPRVTFATGLTHTLDWYTRKYAG